MSQTNLRPSVYRSLPAGDHAIHDLEIDTTNRCNLSCKYCYRDDKGNQDLSLDLGKYAVDWLLEASQHRGETRITLFGGEPLLNLEVIKQLVPYGKRKARQAGKRLHFGMTTNVTLVNDDVLEFWRRYGMGFHLSIDGCPASHDKYRHFPDGRPTSGIIAEKAPLVLKYRPNVMARWTVMPDMAK